MDGNWKYENNRLVIEADRQPSGCVLVGVSTLGVIMVFGMCVYLFLEWYGGTLIFKNTFYATVAGAFGGIAIISGIVNMESNHRDIVEFDKERKDMMFYKTGFEGEYHMSWGSFSHIRATKGSSGGSSDTSVPIYIVGLVKKDGSYFWLDSTRHLSVFREELSRFAKYMDLPVVDKASLGVRDDSGTVYEKQFEEKVSKPSAFVEIFEEDGAKVVRLKEKESLLKQITYFLAAYIFAGIPGVILLDLVQAEGIGGIVFGGGFLFIFILVIAIFFIISFRKYEIRLFKDKMVVYLDFPTPNLQRLLGQSVVIPKEHIRYVRVNRLNDGHFWLSLALSERPKLKYGTWLVDLGIFSRKSARLSYGENLVGLWEMQNNVTPDKGADFADLRYVEKIIEDHFQLKEVPISWKGK